MTRTRWCVGAAFAALFAAVPAHAGTNGTITMSWDPAPPGEQVDGWFIYWGTTQGGPYPNKSPPIPNDTQTPGYVITGLTDCTTYYIVATAYAYVAGDDGGAILESGFSNEAGGWPKVTVTSATPSNAAQNTSVTLSIAGTNFKSTPSNPTVSFDDPAIVVGATSGVTCYGLTAPVDTHCARVGGLLLTVTNADTSKGSGSNLFSVTASASCAPPDAGTPDGGPAAPDASARPDAASPGADAATPRPDAATPRPDAATPRPDAATPRPDAATPRPDAATPRPDAATPRPDAAGPGPDATSTSPDAGGAGPDAAPAPGPDSGPPQPGPDASAPARTDAALAPSDAAASAGADSGGPDDVIVEAGCGCRSAGSGPLLGSGLLLLGLALARRRVT